MAGIGEFPTVLSLEELRGLGRTVDTYLETIQKAIKHNKIEEAKNIIALTTDDLNVMCIVGISCSFCDQCSCGSLCTSGDAFEQDCGFERC